MQRRRRVRNRRRRPGDNNQHIVDSVWAYIAPAGQVQITVTNLTLPPRRAFRPRLAVAHMAVAGPAATSAVADTAIVNSAVVQMYWYSVDQASPASCKGSGPLLVGTYPRRYIFRYPRQEDWWPSDTAGSTVVAVAQNLRPVANNGATVILTFRIFVDLMPESTTGVGALLPLPTVPIPSEHDDDDYVSI